MSLTKLYKNKLAGADRVLLLVLLLSLGFCLHGIHWGRVESWHPDQLVYGRIFVEDEMPLNPRDFSRPPFHTYFNFFFSHIPVYLAASLLGWSKTTLLTVDLLASRMLTVLLFLGSICLVFAVSKRAFGLLAARMTALALGTSAGMIAFSHFLTTDVPVTFWMLFSFFFAQSILLQKRTRDYVLAGFLAGIATATKYNGLAIGFALVAAHGLASVPFHWRRALFDRRLWLGLLMLPVGFLVGNPYALLDYPTFVADFMFNNVTAPIYEGEVTGTSYLAFFGQAVQVIGLPGLVLSLVSLVVALRTLPLVQEMISGRKVRSSRGAGLTQNAGLSEDAGKTILMALAVLLPYYLLFGSFPRLPARFVAPVLPLWVLLCGPLWSWLELYNGRARSLALAAVILFFLPYNLACSYYVGVRFLQDPRMEAQEWVNTNVSPGSTIESGPYAPNYGPVVGYDLEEIRSPLVSGKKRLFEAVRGHNPWVQAETGQDEDDESWYSAEQLLERAPDYVSVDSLYYARFVDQGSLEGEYYPAIREYFLHLLGERYPYTIVFDQETAETPAWVYPSEIDFLHNRLLILRRNEVTDQ